MQTPPPTHLDSYLWLPLAVTLAEVLIALGVLHGAVGRAMRARGHARWRVRDTALVSPLLWLGLALCFASLNHGMLRYALDVERGHAGAIHLTHLAGSAIVAALGLVIAWFGGRAVGKLY
jgi:cytochrome bd-type quinol oxidase subunit 2